MDYPALSYCDHQFALLSNEQWLSGEQGDGKAKDLPESSQQGAGGSTWVCSHGTIESQIHSITEWRGLEGICSFNPVRGEGLVFTKSEIYWFKFSYLNPSLSIQAMERSRQPWGQFTSFQDRFLGSPAGSFSISGWNRAIISSRLLKSTL